MPTATPKPLLRLASPLAPFAAADARARRLTTERSVRRARGNPPVSVRA